MSDNPVFDRIRRDLAQHDVVLFMKGTPMFPLCGVSAAAAQALCELGVKFKSFDLVVDPSLSEGIRLSANAPVLPQLYAKGVLIGHGEALREMARDGVLARALSERGVALPD